MSSSYGLTVFSMIWITVRKYMNIHSLCNGMTLCGSAEWLVDLQVPWFDPLKEKVMVA